jgi:D-sedoheptulose 7-phosphate isomerase
MDLKRKIEEILEESARVKEGLKAQVDKIIEAVEIILHSLKRGGKVLACGNGGSAADAQHFVAELVVRYVSDRGALPAIALSVNPSTVTAASNDYGYGSVFSRQIEALGVEGDVLVAISTSGRSENVNRAVEVAKKKRLKVIYLTGASPPPVEKLCDLVLTVNSKETARIQEGHITILHIVADLIEKEFFEEI